MTNKFDKLSDKPALPVQGAMFGKPCKSSGGRCRARTYDPLIKSQHACLEAIREFFKPGQFLRKANQWLTAEFQTAACSLVRP